MISTAGPVGCSVGIGCSAVVLESVSVVVEGVVSAIGAPAVVSEGVSVFVVVVGGAATAVLGVCCELFVVVPFDTSEVFILLVLYIVCVIKRARNGAIEGEDEKMSGGE